jgi:uncharacterized protein
MKTKSSRPPEAISALPPYLHLKGPDLWLEVALAPRAGRSRIVGLHGGRLKIAVGAPPVDGKANQALIELLAEVLGLPKRAVSIVRGLSSRQKTVVITGAGPGAIEALNRCRNS